MRKVGLTGGIGSGKSTVAKVFGLLGVPVFNSDVEAKNITHTDETVKKSIISLLGKEAYVGGFLNNSYVGEKVFQNKELLQQLNSIIHPAVGKTFDDWCMAYYQNPYIIKEAAILFESGAAEKMDYTITVFAGKETRLKRVMDRDEKTKEEIEKRMENQFTEEQRQSLANFVIDNNGDKLLIPQVLELHKKLGGI